MQKTLIRCDSNQLNHIKESNLNWSYSPNLGNTEIDVIVDDPNNLHDEELCTFYGIDYCYVNEVELL